MKPPGTARLEFEVGAAAPGACTVTQTATFAPRGLAGPLCSYAVAPFHGIVFAGLLQDIRRAAEREARRTGESNRAGGLPTAR